MYVTERFFLPNDFKEYLKNLKPIFGFGAFGETTYYRTYSRKTGPNSHEHWPDTIIRVIEGIFSIRKNHYRKYNLSWRDEDYIEFAKNMAINAFKMKWLPPGRGLWIMGTEYIYERGSAALYNCAAVDTTDLVNAADWAMDMLMVGAGVGFNTAWDGKANKPDKKNYLIYIIEDSKEGWVKSVRLLLESYIKNRPFYRFDYSKIRPAGSELKMFGGIAGGPEPLKRLHKNIEKTMDDYIEGKIDKTRCVVDIFNELGVCVVSGNIRRSAEIAIGSPYDKTFLNLKNYEKYPDRAEIGWISNNSILIKDINDYKVLDEIAALIEKNGEPGILNLENMQHYGRFGEEIKDKAWLSNPCGEIALESYELCNLAEIFISRCENIDEFLKMVEYATFYASTVNLLPTHREETNKIIARNRRVGVSVSGVADFIEKKGFETLIKWLRAGYKKVREINKNLAIGAGIPISLKVTAVKPSGTISILAGTSPGMHYPPFTYAIRRIRIGKNSELGKFLKESNVPYEIDMYDENTYVFEFPIKYDNPKSVQDVTVWEQMMILATLQREWSDNMVSNTIEFSKEYKAKDIANILKEFLPMIKSVTMLPKSDHIYPQMPFSKISKEEYEKLMKSFPKLDWSKYTGHEATGERFCSSLSCTFR
ncbi:fused protease/ribonucleoside-triphosphate reductase [Nitrosophilus kaiyonis]|uniref:fused protease/ribonucleoside-triphosphate reductase n=1 Tax=Nitrosophilus kaiyonis TaxID=2930200 RepID=UPI00249372C3|nr:fused protease/ribonucleoside-triphosphate reductase [Nitrosophilus kaiyonis]